MVRFEFDKKAAITLFICFDYTGFVVYHVDHDMYYGYNNAQYTYVWYNPMENDFRVVTMFPRRNGGEIQETTGIDYEVFYIFKLKTLDVRHISMRLGGLRDPYHDQDAVIVWQFGNRSPLNIYFPAIMGSNFSMVPVNLHMRAFGTYEMLDANAPSSKGHATCHDYNVEWINAERIT